jgi:endonuclease/exonuclease/phosphatase family metal-dependent hydrolase
VKIATWNVWRLETRARRIAVAQWVDRIDADVWVLTETDDALSPGPAYRCVATTLTDRPGRSGEQWVAIWSRLPIEPLGLTNDPSRAVAALVRPVSGQTVIVYGTVLPWTSSRWRGLPSAGGRAFCAALDAQRSDWEVLRRRYPDAELCVAGDLNQDLSEHHYYGSRVARQALRDALSSVGLVALTGDPTDPVRALAPDRASIDHICVQTDTAHFVAPRLEVWPRGSAPDRGVSDHYGVAVSPA